MRFERKVKSTSEAADNISPNSWVEATIHINDSVEDITFPTSFWSENDYYAQWKDAISRIVESPIDCKSAIFTEVHDIDALDQSIGYWALYRRGDLVYVQDWAVPISYIKDVKRVDLAVLYDLVDDYEQGDSTWELTVEDLKNFTRTIPAKT